MKRKTKMKDGLNKELGDPYEFGFTHSEIMKARDLDRKKYEERKAALVRS